MGVFNASLLKDDSSWKLQKTNLLMPEDIAIVSSKSGFDQCTCDRVISVMRKKCGQTAFQLCIVDIYYIYSYIFFLSTYISLSIRYSRSVRFVRFSMLFCISSENCNQIIWFYKKLLNFEVWKIGEISCVQKTCFLMLSHTYIYIYIYIYIYTVLKID